jgi:site-specific recombinase XerC
MKKSLGCSGSPRRTPQGPLVPYLAALERLLDTQGYTATSVRRNVLLVRDFSAWVRQRTIKIEDISPEHAERYLRYRARHRCPKTEDVAGLTRLLDLLREEGIIAQQQACREATPVERLLDQYALYLREERALVPCTVVDYLRVARCFLAQRFGGGRPNLSALCVADVLKFVQHQVARGSRKAAKSVCSALRSFLHYARYRGDITFNLAAGVPTVANWSMSSIPRAIAPDNVRRV